MRRGQLVLATAALLVAVAIGGAGAQDVPYVPTHERVVEEMLRIAGVGKNDVLYDLGAGDGRIVMTAAKQFGTRGVGIELNPDLVRLATENAQQAGVAHLVRFTRIHCDLTGAPPSFVHVRFHTIAPGDGDTAGKPARSAVIDGTIRAGRSREVTQTLLQDLYAMYQRVSGIPEWDLVVALREIPAANVIEAGHILPGPKDEAEWLARHGGSWEAA